MMVEELSFMMQKNQKAIIQTKFSVIKKKEGQNGASLLS